MAKSSFRTHTLRQFAVGCANILLPPQIGKAPPSYSLLVAAGCPDATFCRLPYASPQATCVHGRALPEFLKEKFANYSVTRSVCSWQILLEHRWERPATQSDTPTGFVWAVVEPTHRSPAQHPADPRLICTRLARESAKGVRSRQPGSRCGVPPRGPGKVGFVLEGMPAVQPSRLQPVVSNFCRLQRRFGLAVWRAPAGGARPGVPGEEYPGLCSRLVAVHSRQRPSSLPAPPGSRQEMGSQPLTLML